ncbi:uncharacterized protein LOC111325050 [Stylophora pistillata]|uniref:Uncharacterized protein n=1 Tax=Stylophora pistillata TaxID=50429 RepID=A0A2B4SHI7_STYPI|nr:uncharacterized protein LOC111325050 [Stylophora pistillata]PFX29341.1 hypothetical protein AWC38_SpisGene5882 [Stylophora pistillata]
MGLEVYALVILSSLALLAVAVDAQNDFGEESSGPKGEKLPWFNYEINNYLIYSLSKKPDQEPNDESADSLIAGIVEKILRESEISGVVIIPEFSTSSGERFLSSTQRSRKLPKSGGRA